jgi:hypothetical protein
MKQGTKCPDKIASYIERAFQKCLSPNDHQFMTAILEKICHAHKVSNTLYSRDWDSAALPTLPREGKCKFSEAKQYKAVNMPWNQFNIVLGS